MQVAQHRNKLIDSSILSRLYHVMESERDQLSMKVATSIAGSALSSAAICPDHYVCEYDTRRQENRHNKHFLFPALDKLINVGPSYILYEIIGIVGIADDGVFRCYYEILAMIAK